MIYLTAMSLILTITGFVLNVGIAIKYFELIEDYEALLILYEQEQRKEAMKGEKND